ncbi:MAG TPA: histidine phosphatase family protein [Acidimicrobiales bacterium]|nr:histidine phosphatase family protein [Acidimicrobiales bacterium]
MDTAGDPAAHPLERKLTITLVRHGQTEWSLSGRHTGRTDVPLTETGRRQAMQVGTKLANRRFALVLTSPASRAVDTCRLAGMGEGERSDDLLEWDYGAYEGRTTDDIRAERPGWLLWRDGVPDGEQPADVARRADRLIARLRGVSGDVICFSHGHILRMLAARWVNLGPDGGSRLALDTATISVLGYEREVSVVRLWNEAS